MAKINTEIRAQVYKIIYWQLMMITGLALLLFFFEGIHKSYSALLGGLAYWLPTCVFMWRVSAYAGARAAMRFLAAFFSGEIVKLVLSGILFVFAIRYGKIDSLYGVIGLVGAIVAFWIASMISLYRSGVRS